MRIHSTPLTALGSLLLAVNMAAGAHVLWNTSGEDNWTNPARWSGGSGVPGNSDSAEIGEGAGNGGTAVVNSAVHDILYWRIGYGSGETGTLKIQPGGSLESTQVATHSVGYYGVGYLDVSGGSLDISAGNLYLGYGNNGQGTVTQTDGSISVYNDTYIDGNGASGIGHYDLSGGTVTSRRFLVGLHGIGIMDQSGGTLNVNGHSSPDLTLGWYTDGHGIYNLSAGLVDVPGSYRMRVGGGGTGVFNQSGGEVSVNSELWIGDASTAAGTYNLNGGTVSAYQVLVGRSGVGVVNHSGGTFGTTGASEADLSVGRYAGSTGIYNLTGPTALVDVADDLVAGFSGSGLIQQSNGTVSVTDSLFLGYYNDSQGTYRQTGGLTTIGTNAHLSYYSGSTGTYDLGGGQLNVSNRLYVGTNAGSTGVCNLSGGKITASTARIGEAGTGTLHQTGGELDVSGDMYVNTAAGGLGTYELEGGSVSAGRLLIGLHGTGVFTQTGGDVSAPLTVAWYSDGVGTYTISGGTVSAASLRNGQSGIGLLRIVGAGATITPTSFTQNGLSTLETQIDNDGVSPIAVSGNASLAGSLNVNLRGGTALLANTAFYNLITAGSISGNFATVTAPLWDVTVDTTDDYVRATLDPALPDHGPLPVSYDGLGEIAVDGGNGTNFGYATLAGIESGRDFWVLLDVEKNGADLSGAELNNLAEHVRAGVRTVSTDSALLDDGTLAGYNLAILFDPVSVSSRFAWDFSDYDADLRVAHIAAGVPEPTALALLVLTGLLLAVRRPRRGV